MAGKFGVGSREGGGITLLVLNQRNLAREFAPEGGVFRWMRNVVQEVDHLAVVNITTHAKGYGKGILETSIGHSVTPAGARNLNAHVRSSDPAALFVHNGTRAHEIHPHRPLVRNTTGAKEMFSSAKGDRLRTKFWDHPTGGLVFFWRRTWVRMPHVHHPGITANPFLTDAMSEVLRLRGIKKL